MTLDKSYTIERVYPCPRIFKNTCCPILSLSPQGIFLFDLVQRFMGVIFTCFETERTKQNTCTQ